MSVHLRHLHWDVSTEVVHPDHVISAPSGHEHSTYKDKDRLNIKKIRTATIDY